MRVWYVYLAVFVSGGLILVLEILGTRILAPFYGTTIYVWSSLITVTLLALSSGYLLGGYIADRKHNSSVFWWIYILAGLVLLLTFQYKPVIFTYSDKLGFRFGPLVASLLLFAPPLAILGMVSPFAVKILTKRLEKIGRKAGVVFGFSTIGSLVGSLLAGFFLLPLVSARTLVDLIAVLLVVLGILGFVVNRQNLNIKKAKNSLFVFLALYLVAVPLNTSVIVQIPQKAQILYERENYYGLNRVVAVPVVGGKVCFMVDNSVQTCVPPGPGVDRVGYNGKIGLFIKNLAPGSRVLILGFGSGKLLRDWDREDLSFDIVDINPETFQAARDYSGIEFDSARHSLFVEDARAYLRKNEDQYDFVVVDTFSGFSPPEHLFTREFYQLLASRLKAGGGVILHMLGDVSTADKYVMSLLSTAGSVFNNIYAAEDGISILVVVSQNKDMGIVDLVNKDLGELNITWGSGTVSIFTKIPAGSEFLSADIITDDKNFTEVLWRDKVSIIKQHTIVLPDDYQ